VNRAMAYYRECAAQCERLARTTALEDERELFMTRAAQWRDLAWEEEAQSFASPQEAVGMEPYLGAIQARRNRA
jgi:hypothetical protein